MKTFRLELTDILDGKEIRVNGVRFDAEVNVIVAKAGDFLEIESMQIGPIYLVATMSDRSGRPYNDLFLMDRDNLKISRHSLYTKILTAFEEQALALALETPDYKWTSEEAA